MRACRSFAVVLVVLAAACSSQPTEPDEVLEAWVQAATTGDADTAQTYIASDDIPWIGLGSSPEAYAAGAGPFEADNFFIECTSDHTLGRCNIWWGDRWIDAIPELDQALDGADPLLRVTAEVEDGKIVAFREWVFHPAVISAFNIHTAWLAANQPVQLEAACGTDPAAGECSQLLVDTVDMWVADR